jgi:hypothetical protein
MTIKMDEFITVRDYVVKELRKTGQDVTNFAIADHLITFDSIFPDGIGAMYRFIGWMGEHGYTEHEILPALVHDLNGMREDGFSPRTSTY